MDKEIVNDINQSITNALTERAKQEKQKTDEKAKILSQNTKKAAEDAGKEHQRILTLAGQIIQKVISPLLGDATKSFPLTVTLFYHGVSEKDEDIAAEKIIELINQNKNIKARIHFAAEEDIERTEVIIDLLTS